MPKILTDFGVIGKRNLREEEKNPNFTITHKPIILPRFIGFNLVRLKKKGYVLINEKVPRGIIALTTVT